MDRLGNCKYVNGKLCCWDKEIKRFVEISINLILNPAFYREVTAAFIDDTEQKANEGDG